MVSVVALIPARSGSKRIPNKNIKLLGGKPLVQWTIDAAKASGIFERIMLCSDSVEYLNVGLALGVTAFSRAPSTDDEPDIAWVREALTVAKCDAFAILRPTSPFRDADAIRHAWEHFLANQPADSLRSVEPVKQHPGKMWMMRGGRLLPLLPFTHENYIPWHSSPTQSLPAVFVQNASLEIAWRKTVQYQGAIAGVDVLPFVYSTLDINDADDWERAERIVERGE